MPPVAGSYAWYRSTVGVTDAGGGAVSAWADQSGNGRNLTQGTAGNRPKTGTRTINGLNVIAFDGVDDFLATGNLTQAQPFTIHLVFKLDAPLSGGAIPFNMGVDGPEILLFQQNYQAYSGGSTLNGQRATDTLPHVVTAVFNGASSKLWLDGVYLKERNAGALGLTAEPISLGYYLDPVTWKFPGVIGEVLVYASVLSDNDLHLNTMYLRSDWSIGAGGAYMPRDLRRGAYGVDADSARPHAKGESRSRRARPGR